MHDIRAADQGFQHLGVDYVTVIKEVVKRLGARSYFEIGTAEGGSLAEITCDSVSVDPAFRINGNAIGAKKRAFFFQMTSDDFFLDHDLNKFLPRGIDVAFLDGMHQFEILLRDFINTEKYCHRRSIIFLHDLLPLNERMAERLPRVDQNEREETKYFWTGDVWKLLPIIQKYRPNLITVTLDCPPTGLVACMNLDPQSVSLDLEYYNIIREFANLELSSFGLDLLWQTFPIISSSAVIAEDVLSSVFSIR